MSLNAIPEQNSSKAHLKTRKAFIRHSFIWAFSRNSNLIRVKLNNSSRLGREKVITYLNGNCLAKFFSDVIQFVNVNY